MEPLTQHDRPASEHDAGAFEAQEIDSWSCRTLTREIDDMMARAQRTNFAPCESSPRNVDGFEPSRTRPR